MNCESSFNHKGEPCVTLFPETGEEIDILETMHGKYTRDDGRHKLVMGKFTVEGQLSSVTFVTNPIGHPTTILGGTNEIEYRTLSDGDVLQGGDETANPLQNDWNPIPKSLIGATISKLMITTYDYRRPTLKP